MDRPKLYSKIAISVGRGLSRECSALCFTEDRAHRSPETVVKLRFLLFRKCSALRKSIAFCNSLFADRSGMAASRFLVVTAACVI